MVTLGWETSNGSIPPEANALRPCAASTNILVGNFTLKIIEKRNFKPEHSAKYDK